MNLFGKEPRPTFNDEMKSELAKVIGKEVFEWCNGETPLEDCIEDTKNILRYNINGNGFEIAKDYDDKGYSPDAELVEILDDVCYKASTILEAAVKKWVVEDKIEPQLEIGTLCVVKYGRKTLEGIIDGYKKETAQYKVVIESEGMTTSGSQRAIINYEDAEGL